MESDSENDYNDVDDDVADDVADDADYKVTGGYGDFDNFLKHREYLQGGGGDDEEEREGYDSFTIVDSTVGETGGRFISKTPYAAAYKAASKLCKNNNHKAIIFVIKKITKGSNNRHYAYKATINKLPNTIYIFKKYPDSNKKLVTNKYGEVVLINNRNMIVDISGSEIWEDQYNPDVKLGKNTALKYEDFKEYIIKPINKETVIKSIDLPEQYKNINKTKLKKEQIKEKEKAKALKEKEKEKEKVLKEKALALKKKEKEKAKALKEKEKAKALIEKAKGKAPRKPLALKKKDCEDGKIRNTATGRCVSINGKIGKALDAEIKKNMIKGGNGTCSSSSCF